jgi:hypothetical protein
MKIATRGSQLGLTVFPGEIAQSRPEDLSTVAIPSSIEAY